MSGLRIDLSELGGDLVLGPTGLAREPGLATLCLVSIFTDARARREDLTFAGLPETTQDLRGFWADRPESRLGSRLWLLTRAKQTQETLERARQHAFEALQWLIDEEIVAGIEVEPSWLQRGFLRLRIGLRRGTSNRWAHLWAEPFPPELEGQGLSLLLEAV